MRRVLIVAAAVLSAAAASGAATAQHHSPFDQVLIAAVSGVPGDTATAVSESSQTRIMERLERIKLTGTLEGHLRGIRHRDVSARDSGVMTDLYLRLLEIGIETSFADWASAIAVLNSEWIGDPVNQGDEKVTVDEIHFDLREDGFPLYVVFGKRTLPFGQFENSLVTDPMTQDAYEIKKVGATVGLSGPLGLDLSITAFKGAELMNHLFQSALFDTGSVRRYPLEIDNVESFVISALMSPRMDVLTIFGAFASEPGTDRRNATLNAGLSLALPFHRNVVIDAEYMKALRRESYLLAGETAEGLFKEGVLAATVSYSFVPKRGILRSLGLYRARRQYRRTHPIVAALRYERFDDDHLADRTGAWSVRDRYLGGGRYTFYESGDASIYLGFEYRRTEYRVPAGLAERMNRSNDEVYVDFGFDF
jgi:hypothetical protein